MTDDTNFLPELYYFHTENNEKAASDRQYISISLNTPAYNTYKYVFLTLMVPAWSLATCCLCTARVHFYLPPCSYHVYKYVCALIVGFQQTSHSSTRSRGSQTTLFQIPRFMRREKVDVPQTFEKFNSLLCMNGYAYQQVGTWH